MTESCCHLFAYGTLRIGGQQPAHALLEGAASLGFGKAHGTLYDLGEYPGMVDPRTATDWVRGQVYLLAAPGETLACVDEYEGCSDNDNPPLFTRRVVSVEMASGQTLKAWAYFYEMSLDGARRISSGDYLNR